MIKITKIKSNLMSCFSYNVGPKKEREKVNVHKSEKAFLAITMIMLQVLRKTW